MISSFAAKEDIEFSEVLFGGVKPEKAITYWKSKLPTLSGDISKLSQDEQDRAFMVANITKSEQLQKIYDAIGKGLTDGHSFSKIKKEILETVEIDPKHLETVIRTNLQSAYSAGRYDDMQSSKRLRPYWKYISVNDGRTRASHAALNGVVYPADDPFWQANYPPNGYGCRCDVVSLSERQVAQQGLQVVRSLGDRPPFIVNKEFAQNPRELYKPVLDKYSPELKQRYIENVIDYAGTDEGRLKKFLDNDTLKLTSAIIETDGVRKIGVKNWIDKVLKQRVVKGELAPMGNLPPKITRYLKDHKSEPFLPLVVMDDKQLLHLLRDKKSERAAALTADEIKSIPDKFRSLSTRWFYDNSDKTVLMAFIRDGDNWLKVAIKTDRKIGKGIANEIITAGRVDADNLKENHYEEIKGR